MSQDSVSPRPSSRARPDLSGKRRRLLLVFAATSVLVGSTIALERAPSGLPPSDSPWVETVRGRLTPVSAAEIQSLRGRLAEAVQDLDTRLADLPDGERWRTAWQFATLQELSKAPTADVAKLQAAEAALSLPPPPEVKAAQHAVRDRLRAYLGAAALTPQTLKQLDPAIIALDGVRSGIVSTKTEKEQQVVRDAFQKLAAAHRLPDLLEAFRNEYSQANYRTVMTDEYVHKRAARHIESPLSFQQRAGRINLHVRADAHADTTAVLVPNAERAEIHVLTTGKIPAKINGSSGRIHVVANSMQNLNSTQTLYLDQDGVKTLGPQVCDCSRTSLACLQLCLRLPLLRRLGEGIASQVVAKQLPKHDPEIARKVEKGLAERIGEEGYDIAYRLNGTFRKLYSDRLPKQTAEPRLRISSDADGIYWSAMYADYDEIGALAPPPVAASSLPFDVVHQLHESSIQSWARSLGGLFIDEATYLNLMREDIGLESPTITALPPARRATVLRFADVDPLDVKFAPTGIELKLKLLGFRDDTGPFVIAPKTVTVRYRLAPGKSGIRLVRDAEDFSKDAKWSKVLDGFFPAEWKPVPQFANDAAGEKLLMRYLNIQDGWVIVGSSLLVPADASRDAAE